MPPTTALALTWLSWLASLFAYGPTGLPGRYNGYVEADFVHVSAIATRRTVSLDVSEGEHVKKGDLLFTLDDTHETAALRAAIARANAARAELDRLEAGGRAEEIRAITAELEQARAALDLARSNLRRTLSLVEKGNLPPAQLDADRTAVRRAEARISELEARLALARSPARKEDIIAARARLEAARADMRRAQAALADLEVHAPTDGLVEKIHYRVGEVLPAGRPALTLLPRTGRKVIFFIREPERSGFAIGERLTVSCDGCTATFTATLTRIASEPQYTPPIIYSRAQRTRFVYRAEASLAAGSGLHPGQPVTLTRAEAAGAGE